MCNLQFIRRNVKQNNLMWAIQGMLLVYECHILHSDHLSVEEMRVE